MSRTALSLLAAIAISFVTPVAPALAGESGSAVGDSREAMLGSALELELDAFQGILGEMKGMIESHDKTVPADVKRDHRAGKARYQHAKELHRRGDELAAYKELRAAWSTHRPATDAVLKSMPRERLDTALRHIFSVLDGRIKLIDQLADGTSDEARDAAREGKRLYGEARGLASNGNELAAAQKAFDALQVYDDAVQLVWVDRHRSSD